uniref:Chromo domain-containing protein n=1 Tax=Chromera velia CCMP2878 TaxID=1169474 RepID=A0A0G4IC00_9ALVE|eukprot:Cvel_12985.t1-p1 / transcript=Cvel_12985.t1 / gene=Cvel_12985 / organism=Chromera_velia_CCMP2878 / gene_product=hypothetical protein / transcript_product=hypothetical protein / location=Cvel_scaffold870:38669-40789(+) / protein_length=230 / sequence_SO=supercontig / SO=protein_coding / is_pseudo=false
MAVWCNLERSLFKFLEAGFVTQSETQHRVVRLQPFAGCCGQEYFRSFTGERGELELTGGVEDVLVCLIEGTPATSRGRGRHQQAAIDSARTMPYLIHYLEWKLVQKMMEQSLEDIGESECRSPLRPRQKGKGKGAGKPTEEAPDPLADLGAPEDEEEWEVQEVVDDRTDPDGKDEFLMNYEEDNKDSYWTRAEDMSYDELIAQFFAKREKLRKKQKGTRPPSRKKSQKIQ